MRKIAYLVRPAEGGMKTHLLTLLAGLDRARFTPVVICPSGAMADEVMRAGIEVIPLDIVGALNPVKDVQAALRLRKILKQVKPDLLHLHGAKAGLVGRLALMSRHRPKVILTYHSFVFDERTGAGMRAMVARIERFFLRYTDRIIAVSNALKSELVTEMGLDAEKITVIYNGVAFHDLPKTPWPLVRVGTVARLAPQKGLEYFVRAAALVLSRYPNTSFLVAGDGPLRGYLRDLAKSLAIEEGIEFCGHEANVPAFLATLDVFVLASTRETFGLTVVEALSQRVPVVATRVGGIPEIIDGATTGLLAEPDNPRDLADKILALLDDPAYAQQLADAGCASVRARFTQARMLESTQALYQDLLTTRRKARA